MTRSEIRADGQRLFILVDDLADWAPYYPSPDVTLSEDYLGQPVSRKRENIRVINLCRDYAYLGTGYYCSLLAEARGHRVIPSVRAINDLANHRYYPLWQEPLEQLLSKYLTKTSQQDAQRIRLTVYFGRADVPELDKLAKRLFDLYPSPILQVTLEKHQRWQISAIEPGNLTELSETGQTLFAQAIDSYSRKIWRKPKSRRQFRYDLAILHNSEEKIPPSDAKALNNFIRIGLELGVDVDLIGPDDYSRILEYDALFIRETTAIDHHTYRFAKRAESEGLVVIDDPDSILKCTNKVFLADLLASQGVPTPKTRLLMRGKAIDWDALAEDLGYPIVLNIPDGSFSRGVVKAQSAEQLHQQSQALFAESAILLAQEFVPTEFDWRIGFLNDKPLYACKYLMARGHWQIYNHQSAKLSGRSGGFETMAVQLVPKAVLKVAAQAVKAVGYGLYGVDIKQAGERVVVIEVNDNPSIDSGVEDRFLGDELYRQILAEFIRRLQV